MEESMKQLGLMLSALVMTYAANAVADSPFLKGTYSFTGTGVCLYAFGAPFDSNFLAPINGYYSVYSDSAGTVTYNGDGTATFQQTTLAIRLPPQLNVFQPGASSNRSTSSFTYTLNGDGTFTSNNVPGTFKGAFLSPPSVAGQTFTLENLPTLTGQISDNGKTITEADLSPKVQTVISQNGSIQNRICTNSRVLTKVAD
jgi:hypothetical protein